MAGKDYDVCSNEPDNCSFVDADGNEYVPDEPDTCYNHTGSHHMAAVAWHAFLLLEFKDVHPGHDDRYKPAPTVEEYAEILDKFDVTYNHIAMPDPIPAHLQARLFQEVNT